MSAFLLFLNCQKKSLRAKVDRFKVVTRNICEILSGYLSVFGLSLLPAFTGPSVLQHCLRSGVFKRTDWMSDWTFILD